MSIQDLEDIYFLANYAEWCSILLFENGYEGKSDVIRKTGLQSFGGYDR